MNCFELDLNGEIIRLRLRSIDSVMIEKETKCKLLDFAQDYAITSIITMLTYMRRFEIPNYSKNDAYELYDKLVDNGYTIDAILYDVIYEALAVSGFLTQADLQQMKDLREEEKAKAKNKIIQELQK